MECKKNIEIKNVPQYGHLLTFLSLKKGVSVGSAMWFLVANMF